MRKPPILWHYTDVHGALGIIQQGQLRLGDARFLNDITERRYGNDLVAKTLEEERGVATEMYPNRSDIDKLLRKTASFMEPAANVSSLYLCSFSETPESISQWQRYAADGHGYCLGFDATLLKRVTPLRLLKMSYQPSRQRALIQLEIHRVIQSYLAGGLDEIVPLTRRRRLDYLSLHFRRLLEPVALRLKNPRFEDEHEWRLIRQYAEVAADKPDVMFAARGSYPKPFVSVPLHIARRGRRTGLPLLKVICGPRLQNDLARMSMRHLLDTKGHSEVSVETSPLQQAWR